jgi:AraC-like DNA-binding protein
MQAYDFTLPVHYIRQIANQIGELGVDVPQWLNLGGLSEAQLDDPQYKVSFSTFRQLALDALAMTREPALGLLIGNRLQINTHGMLGFAAINSVTIRQMLELIERYIRLRISVIAAAYDVDGPQVRLVFTETWPLDAIRPLVLEAVVLSVKNMLDHVTLGSCQIGHAAFGFQRPEYAELTAGLFKCEVRYGQAWTGFTLPAEMLDVRLKMADPAAFQEAAQICQREWEKLAANETLAARVRRMLLAKQNGFPSLAVCARLLHMTPRTLHRRLLQEGTSFQGILAQVRHGLAVQHLESGAMSIQEIAYSLGYTDIANFRRAFKRWESEPPSAFRARRGNSR